VALARSLVVEPDILLLDEPLSNLDAKLRERMRTELKELQRRTGITFVYVTHDQAEALALSDQVAVISGGRLQQYGSPFDVYAHPANRMVADFMGLVNLVPGRIRDLKNGIANVELTPDLTVGIAKPDGLSVGERVDVAIRPENIRLAAAAGPPLAKVTNHVFLGNLSEYEVAVASGPVLRVQTHPSQQFKVGEQVALEIDATQCSAFASVRDERPE
jgi:iron(III) transport system ATP-binding protein